MIRLSQPDFSAEEKHAVLSVLDSGMLVQGKEVQAFEEEVAAYVGRKHAIACVNGTAALEMALAAIIHTRTLHAPTVRCPALSWPSPAHAVKLHAKTLVFTDVSGETWNGVVSDAIDPKTISIGIDQFGNPFEWNHTLSQRGFWIEDAACAIGSSLDGKKCGSFGLVSCLSFHPRKVLTTGEGGMALTDDDDLAVFMHAYRNHGQKSVGDFVFPAPNMRMTEMQAALGRVQLKRLGDMIEQRQTLAALYDAWVDAREGIARQRSLTHAVCNRQTYGILLPTHVNKDALISSCKAQGVEVGKLSYNIQETKWAQQTQTQIIPLPNTANVVSQGLALPLHTKMSKDDAQNVLNVLEESLA